MYRIAFIIILSILWQSGCGLTGDRFQGSSAQNKGRKDCWSDGDAPTLLSVMHSIMKKPLEADLERDNYIQTFGCAYEEVDIERNAIQAVHRAILQSLRNRNVTVRDDLLALLQSRPPRPDNLIREYTVYANLPANGADAKVASYQVRILDLEVVHTVESPVSIWTRVATRFTHPEDHYRALPVSTEKSAFVNVIERAQNILSLVERGKSERILEMLAGSRRGNLVARPASLRQLSFADTFVLLDEQNPNRKYPAIFLGKGIALGETPRQGKIVFKFGEERLFGMRLDLNRIERLTDEFIEFNYQAPETILQCLFLKASRKKPAALSSHSPR